LIKFQNILIILKFILVNLFNNNICTYVDVTPTKKDTLRKFTHNQIPKLKILIEKYIYAVHISIFYINGRYYEISKRLFNNRYVS